MNLRLHHLLIACIALLAVFAEARVGGEKAYRELYYGGGGGARQYYRQHKYYGGGYYARRYYNRYYRQNKYYQNNQVANDDATADGDEAAVDGDDGYYNADGNSTTVGTWREKIDEVEGRIEEEFINWYETSPGEWTSDQWAWFSFFLIFVLCIFSCACISCINCCKGKEDKKKRKNQKFDFDDDYTSVGTSTRGSFFTKGSQSSEFDDTATYDSIMRLRSD